MSEQAQVRSIEAIKDFRAVFATFGEDAAAALGAVEMEIRRTQQWLENEQFHYWQRQIRERHDDVAIAKSELARKRLRGSPDNPVDLTEEKKALRLAQRRLEEAEEKLEETRKWARLVEKASLEYQGFARQLENYLDTDLERGLALLGRMIESLEAYANLAAPSEMAAESGAAKSAARPAEGPDEDAEHAELDEAGESDEAESESGKEPSS
jgi:hypothetical protein